VRALLAMRLEYTRATQIAASLGTRGIAFLLGFIGLFTNPLLVFTALFVWMARARVEYGSDKVIARRHSGERAMLDGFPHCVAARRAGPCDRVDLVRLAARLSSCGGRTARRRIDSWDLLIALSAPRAAALVAM